MRRLQRRPGHNFSSVTCQYPAITRYLRDFPVKLFAPESEPSPLPQSSAENLMTLNAWIIALNPENPVALELKRTLEEQGIATKICAAVDGRKEMPATQG